MLCWFRIRTITLAFRRASVCVCLVGFASLQSPWAHTLKASLPLYERSVGFATVQSLCAFISGFLAFLAPPVAPNTAIPTTIAKGQHPFSPHNLPKPHYPPKKHYILSQPNLFRTSLTSPSTRAILLLALAKTN